MGEKRDHLKLIFLDLSLKFDTKAELGPLKYLKGTSHLSVTYSEAVCLFICPYISNHPYECHDSCLHNGDRAGGRGSCASQQMIYN